jgi:molecular chaperone DnaJ
MNYYQILNVDRNATLEEIRKSYLKLATKYHPDVYKLDNGEKFKEIKTAYDTLSTTESKLNYDRFLDSNINTSNKNSYEDFQRQQNSRFNNRNNFSNASFQNEFFSFGENNILENLFENAFFGGKQGQTFFFYQNEKEFQPEIPNIILSLELNFIETAFGCTKEINFKRKYFCNHCKWWNNKYCIKCNYHGFIEKDEKIKIDIPGCISDDSSLKISRQGHIFKNFLSDIILKLKFTRKINNIQLVDKNIIQYVYLSIFDAFNTKFINVKNCLNKLIKLTLPNNIQSGDMIIFKKQGGKDENNSIGDYIYVILFYINRDIDINTKNMLLEDKKTKDIIEFKFRDIYTNNN